MFVPKDKRDKYLSIVVKTIELIVEGAIQSGDFSVILKFLTAPVSRETLPIRSGLLSLDRDGASLLHIASQSGCLQLVDYLIQKGFDVNKRSTQEGRTPLSLASQYGHAEVVRRLISAKANIELCDKQNTSPLFFASWEGHREIVQLLIEAGANPNREAGKDFGTPLYVASQQGHLDVVKCLLAHGARVDYVSDSSSETALYAASAYGHVDVIQCLIEAGANPDKRLSSGSTPLQVATQENHIDAVKYLISIHKESIDLSVLSNGQTLLMLASSHGHTEIVQYLIDTHVEINLTSKQHLTALCYAASNGHLNTVEALLAAGALVDESDNTGLTALFVAVLGKKIEVVERLINAHADVNISLSEELIEEEGHPVFLYRQATPLMAAAFFDHLPIFKVLYENGGDMTKRDSNGKTALDYAISKNSSEVIRFIAMRDAVALRETQQTVGAAIPGKIGLGIFPEKKEGPNEDIIALASVLRKRC